MNADKVKLDESDPVHQQLEELVWLAQDLRQRARLEEVPALAHARAGEIADLAGKVRDYFDALRQDDAPPATPPADNEEAPPATSPSANVSPANELHPYTRAGGPGRGRTKAGGG